MLNKFFKSLIDADKAPIVICDLSHIVVYMNPSAIKRYRINLTGKSIKNCHNPESSEKIEKVVNWFKEKRDNNIVFTSRNEKENKDVYMVALRDDYGELIGYYEKHEYRNNEVSELYKMKHNKSN